MSWNKYFFFDSIYWMFYDVKVTVTCNARAHSFEKHLASFQYFAKWLTYINNKVLVSILSEWKNSWIHSFFLFHICIQYSIDNYYVTCKIKSKMGKIDHYTCNSRMTNCCSWLGKYDLSYILIYQENPLISNIWTIIRRMIENPNCLETRNF